MKFLFIKKIVAVLLLFLIFYSSSAFLSAPVQAGLASGSVVNDPIHTASTVAGWAAKAWEFIKEQTDKMLRDIIAKRIIDHIVNETVKWINGDGDPKFIGNWSAFVQDAKDIAFDSVARELNDTVNVNLCAPFSLQLRMSFLPVEKFGKQISCTLDQAVSNIKDFYTDFSVGGWEGYMLSWEPNNNFYGAYLLVSDEISKRQSEGAEAAKNKAAAGGGFLGVETCKPGTAVNLSYLSNEEKEEVIKEGGFVKDSKGDYCSREDLETTTPGGLVGAAMADAVGADSKWAASIQSWTSALVNALINRLMKEGLSRINSSSSAPERYYPPEYQGLKERQRDEDRAAASSQIKKIKDAINPILTSKKDSLNHAKNILSVSEKLKNGDCSAGVTDDDIKNASSTVDKIQSEVNELQNDIDEIDGAIAANETTDESATSTANTQFNLMAISRKYTSRAEQIGSDQAAAQKENDEIKVKSANLNGKLINCQISINGGAATTTSLFVNLTFNNKAIDFDISSPTHMMISNDKDFSGASWETYSSTKSSWQLSSTGNKIKTVFVKIKDENSGKISDPVYNSINYSSYSGAGGN